MKPVLRKCNLFKQTCHAKRLTRNAERKTKCITKVVFRVKRWAFCIQRSRGTPTKPY
jgi:hypothetical protein